MADNKEKTQFFIGGMLVGLIIAGSFFIFKLDDYFEKLKLYKNITKTFYLKTKKDKIADVRGEEKITEQTLITVNKSEDRKENETQKDLTNELRPDGDTTAIVSLSDSLPDLILDEDEMEHIVIQKDEIIASSQLQIIDLNPLSASEKASDSLVQKVSGIKDERTMAKKNVTVELWKSPLHYKGYKMSKNKLILYGFPSLEGIKIFKLDDIIYIKAVSNVYRLEQSYDYKPYQHVDDLSIINKLK